MCLADLVPGWPSGWALVLTLAVAVVPSDANAADVGAGCAISDHTCLNCHAVEVGANPRGDVRGVKMFFRACPTRRAADRPGIAVRGA